MSDHQLSYLSEYFQEKFMNMDYGIWISDFSHQSKEFDQNKKCSERSEYSIFSEDKYPFFTRFGGVAQRGQCHLFTVFFHCRASVTGISNLYLLYFCIHIICEFSGLTPQNVNCDIL